MAISFKSYDELEVYIRNWTSWADKDVYDVGGSVYLLAACLSNIQRNAVDGDLEEFAGRLDDEQQLILPRLAELVAKARASPDED